MKTRKVHFRPRAKLLLVLGDQLICDAGIAVFELVKNADDADSPDVNLYLDSRYVVAAKLQQVKALRATLRVRPQLLADIHHGRRIKGPVG